MSDYSKLIRKIEQTGLFTITKSTRKTTVKIKYLKNNEMYTVHPGKNAVFPLNRWFEKMMKHDSNGDQQE